MLQWREAASVILVTRTPNLKKDFKILMLKRSSRSKFMPSAQVFPGGVVDKSDFNYSWLQLFKNHNVKIPTWQPPVKLPMIYENKQSYEDIPRELAFRINAIRETFEETGLLLSNEPLETVELKQWRKEVHNDPSKFLQMCQELKTCPDVNSLHEWSDWLTPLHLKTKSRFDTMFYIAFSEKHHDLLPTSDGDIEVSAAEFLSPHFALQAHLKEQIWLAPPQFYELSRLAAFDSFDKLKSFCENRAKFFGVETWFPVMARCQDGAVALYPGDEAYPENPDINGTRNEPVMIDASELMISDFSPQAVKKNRMELRSQYDNKIVCTIQDPCGHAQPATGFVKQMQNL